MRAYCPATPASLARWYAAGSVPAGQDWVVAESEEEEAEYLALMSAADLCADGARRRVVVVAAQEPAAALPFSEVVAVHADTEDDASPEDELGWFAPGEVPALLAACGA